MDEKQVYREVSKINNNHFASPNPDSTIGIWTRKMIHFILELRVVCWGVL